jgi:hypothetical protein
MPAESHLNEGIASFEEDEELQLNAGRQAMAVHYTLSVLTGGAGTGKITVFQVILTLRNKWEGPFDESVSLDVTNLQVETVLVQIWDETEFGWFPRFD